MPNGTDPRGDRAPRPNKILATPDTVASCAAELRRDDPNGRQAKAAQARNQFADTRMSGAN